MTSTRLTWAELAEVAACPVCFSGLAAQPGVLRCPKGHSFDVARQGYVNLFNGPAPAHADSAAMLDARARVHESGLLDPVSDVAAQRMSSCRTVVEVGAGTGHYLAKVLDQAPAARGVALDISVPAAKRAARAHARAVTLVADVWQQLPLRSSRFDGVLCAFAPRNMAEFARVLIPGGLLVVVTPTSQHLVEVRRRYGLLDIDADKDDRLLRSASGLFEPIGRQKLEYQRHLEADVVRDVIAMGPNAFHGLPTQVAATELTVSVVVHLFRSVQPL